LNHEAHEEHEGQGLADFNRRWANLIAGENRSAGSPRLGALSFFVAFAFFVVNDFAFGVGFELW